MCGPAPYFVWEDSYSTVPGVNGEPSTHEWVGGYVLICGGGGGERSTSAGQSGVHGGGAPNNIWQKPQVNWFANNNCQYAYLNSKYGSGAAPFVTRFSLLSYTPLASGPSANASETIVPTIGTEGTKVGVGYLLKLGGASSETLSGWGAMTLIPSLAGTLYDAEAKYACKDVTGIDPQGW